MERGKNGRAYLWRKTTTHGPRRTIHDGNRQVMLKCSGAKQAFLLSPQSSALITYLLTLTPDTRNLKPLLVLINLPGPRCQSKAQPFETVFYLLANTLTHTTH